MFDDGGRPLAEFATNSLAGSKERIECYAARWQSGYAIFNPSDNPHCLPEYAVREAPTSGIRTIKMPKQRHSLSNALC